MPKPTTNAATLRRLLQQELLLGQQMVTLADEMSATLISNDVPRLGALEAQQRQLVEKQTALEEARLNATRDLAFALGMDRIPTLSGLLAELPPRDQEALQRLRLQILEADTRLGAINRRNRELLENAMEYVRFSLELLTSAALQPARYGTNLAAVATPVFYIDSKA